MKRTWLCNFAAKKNWLLCFKTNTLSLNLQHFWIKLSSTTTYASMMATAMWNTSVAGTSFLQWCLGNWAIVRIYVQHVEYTWKEVCFWFDNYSVMSCNFSMGKIQQQGKRSQSPCLIWHRSTSSSFLYCAHSIKAWFYSNVFECCTHTNQCCHYHLLSRDYCLHDMQLMRSTYKVLQILSISLTDKTHLRALFDKTIFNDVKKLDYPLLRDYLIN